MKGDEKIKKVNGRGTREDGDATKNRIIEAAGRLFAERGYAETTSKEICETVGANMAAVNYHFGNRDGLYLAVLEKVRTHLADYDALSKRLVETTDPHEKLGHFIEAFLRPAFERQSWMIRLWARELVSPSLVGQAFRCDREISGFCVLLEIVSELTGIPVDDPDINYCVLNIMGPFMVLLMVNPERSPHAAVYAGGERVAVERLKEFMIGGLEAYGAKYGKREGHAHAYEDAHPIESHPIR